MSRSPAHDSAALTIDLGALADNWRILRDRAAPAECGAVLKADAYGTGLEPAARALRAAGCRTYFVAHLAEAARLRATLPEAVVYVLNGLLPGTAPRFAELKARPILGSRAEIEEWAAFCALTGRCGPAAIHVDTGMNRLGLSVGDALGLAGDPLLKRFEPTLVMSHLVAAEEPDDPVNARQAADFAKVRDAYPDVPASLANSSGIFHPGITAHDLARPGYALYGGNPTPGAANPMRPVVMLEASVVQLREVRAGERVGYNGRWTAPGPRRLATLSLGYADGYLRSASTTDAGLRDGLETGIALVAGRPCPIVGRISMDLTILDVTDVEGVARGDRATLIGGALDVDEVGRRAGTIGYEILTGLGSRYERRYLGAEPPVDAT